MSRNSMPKEAIEAIKALGYRVYMRDRSDSYAIFEDQNGKLGYVQFEPWAGYSVSTVHVPNQSSGTGYQIARHVNRLTADILAQAVNTIRPSWATHDPTPEKYNGMEECKRRDKFRAAYKEVEP